MSAPLKAPSEKAVIPYDRTPDGVPRFQGCSKIHAYEVLGKLGEGTFGEVHKARTVKDGHLVALKKILMHNEKDGFPITALREIKLLKTLSHENVLRLEEMAVESRRGDGKKKAFMYMVTPYMDHDLSGLLENPAVRITEPQIKCYMLQLLEGVRYLHAQKILHRDMKAANLLINNRGILQIADFGLARPYDEDPPQPGKGGGEATRDYTTLVVTRWYRPPELLLQLRKYTTAIDMWGVGCVFGEMFKKRPILAGKSDLNQLQLIFQLVGSPTEDNMPGWSDLPGFKKEGVTSYGLSKGSLPHAFRDQGAGVISLLTELLKLDWRKRINAIDALQHSYFKSAPLPARPGDIPQFEESHELDRRKFRDQQAALPPAPAGGTVGIGPQQEGGQWANGSAPHSNGNAARRPPGGMPRRDNNRSYDNRGPPPHNHHPRDRGHEGPLPHHNDRRPAWDRDRDRDRDRYRNNAPPPNTDLPPRPPVDASWSQLDSDPHRPRHNYPPAYQAPPYASHPPHSQHGGARHPPPPQPSYGLQPAPADTYIPSCVGPSAADRGGNSGHGSRPDSGGGGGSGYANSGLPPGRARSRSPGRDRGEGWRVR